MDVVGGDLVAGERDGPLEDVFQFAHIAGEAVTGEPGACAGTQFRTDVVESLAEVLREEGKIQDVPPAAVEPTTT